MGIAVPTGTPSPGRITIATVIPTVTAIPVVKANRPTVRRPSVPSRLGSASDVMPAAIVTSTIGATSMRIARMNRSPMKATPGAAAGQTSPRTRPSASAPSTRCHRGMANQPRIMGMLPRAAACFGNLERSRP